MRPAQCDLCSCAIQVAKVLVRPRSPAWVSCCTVARSARCKVRCYRAWSPLRALRASHLWRSLRDPLAENRRLDPQRAAMQATPAWSIQLCARMRSSRLGSRSMGSRREACSPRGARPSPWQRCSLVARCVRRRSAAASQGWQPSKRLRVQGGAWPMASSVLLQVGTQEQGQMQNYPTASQAQAPQAHQMPPLQAHHSQHQAPQPPPQQPPFYQAGYHGTTGG